MAENDMGSVQKQVRSRPARTPEGRENQMIALAVDKAEELLRSGRASSQIICHYLKLAASKEKEELEKKLLEQQVQLAAAKTEALKDAKRYDQLYEDAIAAMKKYGATFRE